MNVCLCIHSNTGGVYDPSTDSWLPTSQTIAPVARWHHTAVWTGQRMVVWGGLDDDANTLASGAVYDPVADTWSPTSLIGSPSRRFGHSAIWTGARVIIFGGGSSGPGGGDRTNTGGRYDP